MAKIKYSPFMADWVEMLKDVTYESAFNNGRTLGNKDRMQRLRLRPGLISAEVFSSGYAYNHETRAVKVTLPTFSDAAWEQIIARLAREQGLITQLLAAELPDALVQLCTTVGVRLIPLSGEFTVECEFDNNYFCKHTVAVCYKLGLMIDADPFVLLALRGRTREQLLAPLGLAVAQPTTTPIPTDLAAFWRLDNPWPQLQTEPILFANDELPLAHLGNPPDWNRGNLSDTLLSLYQHIGKLALHLLDLYKIALVSV
jgi:uncharacterized Zn finger protein